MKVINLFGGPGVGKSTTAYGLSFFMKLEGLDIELINEYAKDMVWEGRHNVLSDQCYILAKQRRKVLRLENQVEWVVADSPFILGLVYDQKKRVTFEPYVMELWNEFENVNYYLTRNVPYVEIGRVQTEDEAKEIDEDVLNMLNRVGVPFKTVTGGTKAIGAILDDLGLCKNFRPLIENFEAK